VRITSTALTGGIAASPTTKVLPTLYAAAVDLVHSSSRGETSTPTTS